MFWLLWPLRPKQNLPRPSFDKPWAQQCYIFRKTIIYISLKCVRILHWRYFSQLAGSKFSYFIIWLHLPKLAFLSLDANVHSVVVIFLCICYANSSARKKSILKIVKKKKLRFFFFLAAFRQMRILFDPCGFYPAKVSSFIFSKFKKKIFFISEQLFHIL